MEWLRGDTIGHGSFSTVTLAKLIGEHRSLPSLMAVKSSPSNSSHHLRNEEYVFQQLGSCPEIVRCFGSDTSVELGREMRNLFLEHASRGTLATCIERSNGGMSESKVRRCTRAIVRGLRHVHVRGFVHCDLKPENVVLLENGDVKISDFGLAKKISDRKQQGEAGIRGTPLYMAPESLTDGEFGVRSDIWALGCCVVEMSSGKTAWNLEENLNIASLIMRIGIGYEIPRIPEDMSEEGRDFVSKCLVKDPNERWTAEMLLTHPFGAPYSNREETAEDGGGRDDPASVSPRSPFGFPVRDSVKSSVQTWVSSSAERVRRLVIVDVPKLVDFW